MSLTENQHLKTSTEVVHPGGAAVPVHRHIEAHAAGTPERVAVQFANQQLTYGQLNEKANQLARFLLSLGVRTEVPVAVCLTVSLEIPIALLALLKAGGAYLPLDPTDPAERIAIVLRDSRPRVILTQSHLLRNLPPAPDAEWVCLDRDWPQIQLYPTINPALELDLEQAAYLVYTSGTTGSPKGVIATHGNLVHYILSAHDRYDFNPQDVMPAMARFTFSISLFELLTPLVAGGRLLLLERDRILNFGVMVQVLEQITVIHASPSWWRRFLIYLQTHRLPEPDFSRLRHASSGGDLVPGDLLEAMKRVFHHTEIFVIYGCTEISCMGCTFEAPRDRTVTKASLGKPFTGVKVCLLDRDQHPVAHGLEGEIYVGGLGVTKGYLNLPKLTEDKFLLLEGDRFYRTGDLGRYDGENLEIKGRIDFQIQLRGIRIEPGEIETQLRKTPGVREAVVVARELAAGEKSLIAYIVLENGTNYEVQEIRRFLKTKLPDYMLPAAFVVLDALPLNSNWKIDRQALPPPTSDNLAKLKGIDPPRDDWERQLIEIWEKTLGIRPIGIRNSLLELGADSLQAVNILMEIEERWNKNLPISILVEANSIEELAGVIRDREESRVGSEDVRNNVVPLRRGSGGPPLFCLQGVLLYQSLAQHLDPDQPVYAVFLPEEVELIKTRRYDPVNSVFATIEQIAASYLRSIQSVQPHGPYCLAGSSFAGLIAFEIAHELQAAGEEVAFVAMFDSMMLRRIPLRRRLQCHWTLFRQQGVSYLARKAASRFESFYRRLTIPPEEREGQIRSIPRDNSVVTIEAQQDILDEVSVRAAQSYLPRPYSGKLLLFRANDQSFFSEDVPDLGWTPFADGGLEIHNIPGNHMGILKPPSVALLAQELQRHLVTISYSGR